MLSGPPWRRQEDRTKMTASRSPPRTVFVAAEVRRQFVGRGTGRWRKPAPWSAKLLVRSFGCALTATKGGLTGSFFTPGCSRRSVKVNIRNGQAGHHRRRANQLASSREWMAGGHVSEVPDRPRRMEADEKAAPAGWGAKSGGAGRSPAARDRTEAPAGIREKIVWRGGPTKYAPRRRRPTAGSGRWGREAILRATSAHRPTGRRQAGRPRLGAATSTSIAGWARSGRTAWRAPGLS